MGVTALLALVVVLVLRTERAGDELCTQLERRLPELLDADVTIGSCRVDPLSFGVRLVEVGVRPHAPGAPTVMVERASVSLRSLTFGGLALQDVELVKPRVELTVTPSADPAREPAVCPLTLIERLRVESLHIVDGAVVVRVPSRSVSVRVEGVNVDASLERRDAELRFDARGGVVELSERTLHLGRLTVDAELDRRAEVLEVMRAAVNVEGNELALSGRLDSLCDAEPVLDLQAQAFLPLENVARVLPSVPAASGQIVTRLSLSGKPGAPSIRGQVQASGLVIGKFAPGDFSARLVLNGKTLVLEELVTTSGEGEVRVSGQLELENDFPVTAKVETREASFARIMARASVPGAWVEFRASVKGTLTGHLLPSPSLGGDVDFKVGRFTLAARPFDAPRSKGRDILAFEKGSGRFHFGVTPQAVRFDDVSLVAGARDGTRVTGTVVIFPQQPGLEVDVVAETIDLADYGSIVEQPWSGVGSAQIKVRGPFAAIQIDGQVALRDFKFANYALGVVQSPVRYAGSTLSFPAVAAQKGQTQYFGDLALTFAPDEMQVSATAQLPDGRVEDVVDLLSELSPSIANLQDGVLTGRLSALAAIDCPASQLTGVIASRMRDVRLLDRRLGEADLVAHFEGGEALVVDSTTFTGPIGTTALGGSWRFDGPLDFHAGIEHGSLAELIDPSGERSLPVGGTFVAKGDVGGSTDLVLVSGWLSSPEVRWKAHALGPLHVDLGLTGRALEAKGTLFPGVRGTMAVTFAERWPGTAHLEIDLPDLMPLLPIDDRTFSAGAKGVVDAKGPLLDYEAGTATVRVDTLELARGEVSVRNAKPVELGWSQGGLELRSVELAGPTTQFAAQGRWGPTNADVQTQGSIDLRLLSSLVSSLERTAGTLDFSAAISGPTKTPAIAGSATVTDARFSVKGYDLAVRSLNGRADFSESRVLVQDLQGFLNDGKLRTRGDLKLNRFSLAGLELQTDLDAVSVEVLPEVPATMSGSLLVASRDGERFQLSGGLDLVRFRYTQPLQLEALLARAREDPLPSEEAAREEWLRFDVDLRTAGDVRIENNLAKARLLGKLKLSGTNLKPVLSGSVETAEGAQAYFRRNTFAVQRGQLVFNGLWPTFDLSAQSQIREYLVTVKAFGRLDDPKISLSSEPMLPDADILSLVTLGVTSREKFDATSGVGLAAEALLTASGLEAQVQRFLGQDMGLFKEQQVRFTTSYSEVSGAAEPAVAWESKVLSDNFKLGVTAPISGRGIRAKAEYQFNQQVSARGQWDNENQITTLGNPGVELRFRFEWE